MKALFLTAMVGLCHILRGVRLGPQYEATSVHTFLIQMTLNSKLHSGFLSHSTDRRVQKQLNHGSERVSYINPPSATFFSRNKF